MRLTATVPSLPARVRTRYDWYGLEMNTRQGLVVFGFPVFSRSGNSGLPSSLQSSDQCFAG
eukprot:5290873-Prorocentrum_lima.AAC.1